MSEQTNLEAPIGCPFCGKTPAVKKLQSWGCGDKHLVACSNNACHVAPTVIGATLADAIRRWNTRATKTQDVTTQEGDAMRRQSPVDGMDAEDVARAFVHLIRRRVDPIHPMHRLYAGVIKRAALDAAGVVDLKMYGVQRAMVIAGARKALTGRDAPLLAEYASLDPDWFGAMAGRFVEILEQMDDPR
jgi:hypothetical protein